MQEGFINTSGQGKDAIVPKEAQFYNFGAALLKYYWLVANGLHHREIIRNIEKEYKMFYLTGLYGLGWKANEIAWKYRRWNSLEEFMRVQRRWSLFGRIVMTACIVTLAVALPLIFYLFFIVKVLEK